ncbi:MAG: protein phosphatase 2C domain-containing protein [Acidobacteria bacterium]|nr:protein phosphatase 2C domain-containing protein [Acidobacteriota bacterium]
MDTHFGIRSAAVSDRGLSEKRPQNEDSFLEINKKGIFAVADGVGGANAGEVASQMAVEILGEAFTNFPAGADVEHVMQDALEKANSAIHQMSNDLSQLSKMATTVVALHVAGDIATIGHVGDSRLYRLDPEGTLFRETDDHSMVAEEVRAGRMTEEQAENHPSKNIISRALGAEPTVQVDMKTIMIVPGTKFLLCSDGVTRHIGDIELAELLASDEDSSTICQQIKTICFQRGAEDNLTAVIVEVGSGAAVSDTSAGAVADNDDLLSLPDDEEMTIATARFPQPSQDDLNGDDEDLLELETRQLTMPAGAQEQFEPEPIAQETEHSNVNDDAALHDTIPFTASDTAEIEMPLVPAREEPIAQAQVSQHAPVVAAPVYSEPPPVVVKEDNFSMFGQETGGTVADRAVPEPSSSIGSILGFLGMLVVGTLIGLGVYHFFLKPAPVETKPPVEEMRSRNIPLSAFEENRRDVDKDPAGYLSKNTQPQDCEDFYLVGRAYMLSGDYPKARNAFAEARRRLAEADPSNAKVIESDVAMAMAVTNDTTIQNILKKELEPVKAATPR